MTDVIVVGGGIAGIAAARAHLAKGARVLLIEQSSHLGGVLNSTSVNGVTRNDSAQTIALTAQLEAQFTAWGVMKMLSAVPDLARIRCIVHSGRIHRISHPLELLTSGLIPMGSAVRVLRRLRRRFPNGDPTVAEVGRHYADDVVVQRLARPIINGIYAGDPERLSFSACFPSLAARLRDGVPTPRSKRRIATPENGMRALIDALSWPIKHVHLNTPVISIAAHNGNWLVATATESIETRTLVLATGATQTAALIEELDPPLAARLAGVTHSGVLVLHCSYQRSQARPLRAFGALWADVGPVRGVMDLNVITRREDDRQYLVIYGDPLASADAVIGEVRRVLGIKGEITIDHEVRWKESIPQYVVGHGQIINLIDTFEQQYPGLHVIGSFRGGVSIADRVQQGVDTA
jgi:protoporphyrinogen/coproporphyrinogen III oxidase